jgi:hypothetical protein
MSTILEWLKAVPMSFVGAKVEPVVELLSSALVVVIFVTFLVQLLSRPPMIALVQRMWSLLKNADSAFKYKTQYAPEMERFRRRVAPYGDLVVHAMMVAVLTLCIAVVIAVPAFAARPGVPWYAPIIGLAFLGMLLPWWRYHIASTSWAWHAIKTGEERPPRTPQLCNTLTKRLDRDIAKLETKVSLESAAVLPDQTRST